MYDQAYNPITLAKVLRRGDFNGIPKSAYEIFRQKTASAARDSAESLFHGKNPLAAFHLKHNSAYKIKNLADDLVARKLTQNIQSTTRWTSSGRTFLVNNLCHFLREGTPYKVYRLDIKSFYESFQRNEIEKSISDLRALCPLSKLHLTTLLNHYGALGGKGLPRGMALSAVVSDFMMSTFDTNTLNEPFVYFYGRYVDDIVIVTNNSENESEFLKAIAARLPSGLFLNDRKTSIRTAPKRVTPVGQHVPPTKLFAFDYLGYELTVFEPSKVPNTKSMFRDLRIEIASAKIKKIKTRISRSFLDFTQTGEYFLLADRIRFLTSNFSISDKNTGRRMLAGIYYGYPLLSSNSKSLDELDRFVRTALLAPNGHIFKKAAGALSGKIKRLILGQRFTTGHSTKRFQHFSTKTIGRIQECWRHE